LVAEGSKNITIVKKTLIYFITFSAKEKMAE